MTLTWKKFAVLPVAMMMAGTVAMAQTPAPTTAAPSTTTPDPTIAQRKENQQQRIGNGVQSGQLTAGETANLETKEAAINGETEADRAANGGKLTGAEKTQINGQQNKLSNQIYDDKHNAATQNYGKSEVGQRQTNQQQRIAQGIGSGRLNARQGARLERREASIGHQERHMRAADGGRLTHADRIRLHRRLNRTSRAIYRAKHRSMRQ